jgi:DNA-binding NtrC family response regulator
VSIPWYGEAVTIKEKVLQAVQDLPDDASIEDAMERLLFLARIEKGVRQANAGQTIPNDHVKLRMAKSSALIERRHRLESDLIRAALERCRWNKTKAAEDLGLKRTTLQYKIKKYGLEQ